MPSAEEAAYLNAQYRNANGIAPDPLNAQILASQNGLQYQQAQDNADAQRDQQKHDVAFSQPRDDTLAPQSAAYYAIVNQYNQQHQNSIGSGGAYAQPTAAPAPSNPYPSDTAAGIAWDVARTGGGTDTRMNDIAKAEIIAVGGDPSFIRYASDIYVERPSYPQETLTTKSGMTFTNDAWAGVPIRLNLTESEMASGAGINTDNYKKYLQYNPDTFMLNPISKNGVDIGVDTGVHTRFGDFGGPILKDNSYGGWTGNGSLSEPSNPVYDGAVFTGLSKMQLGSGTTINNVGEQNLPEGYGGFGVMAAGNGVNSVEKAGDYGLPRPFVSNGKDVANIMENPTGDIYGFNIPLISPALAFFQQGKSINTKYSDSYVPEVSTITPTYTGYLVTTTGGKVTTETKTIASTPSGFETLLNNTEKSATDLMWSGNKPQITTEQIKSEANYFAAVPGAAPFTIALQTPVLQDYAASYLKGEAQGFIDKPVQTVAAFGIGLGFGTLFKGVETGIEATRVSVATKAISEGGGWRSAEQFAANVQKVGGAVLGTIYAADVGARVTNMGTDFSPAAAERFGNIVATEARPMTAGAIIGYAAPGKIYDTVKLSEQGYQQALLKGRLVPGEEPTGLTKVLDLSGSTTGRFDYYVKQPAMKPYELLKQDYNSFTQEGGTGKFNYVLERTGLNYVPSPEPTTLKYSPSEIPTGFQVEAAYGKQNTIFDYFTKGTYEQPTTLKYNPAQTGEVAQAAYGDVKSPFSTLYDIVNAATLKGEQTTPNRAFFTEKTSNGLSQKAYSQETLKMRYDAYMQENPNIVRDFKTNWQNPAKEISDYNTMYRLSKTNVNTPGSTSAISKTPFGAAPSGRIGTKVVGGKTVGGLSREPSLKSMGISEPAGGTSGRLGFAERHATDFRNAPASATMKPMDLSKTKRASGSMAIMSEPLPMVEGMTQGKQQRNPQSQQGVIRVVDPDLMFAQEQQQSRQQQVSPRYAIESAQMFDVVQQKGTQQSLEQEQRRAMANIQMQNTGQGQYQTNAQQREALSKVSDMSAFRGIDYARSNDYARAVVNDQTRRTDFATVQERQPAQTTRTTTIPKTPEIYRTVTVPTDVIPKIPGLPYIPAGGSGYGSKRRPRQFTELLPIGLDISTFGGRTRVRGKTKPKKATISKALSVKRKKK